ncbi:MAG: glycosyltransferase family 39 protein, partial [Chloroflexi bacterium]|nr:glycosyltransferase family 39 protein [Chloroflexota bacterium]
MGEPQELKNELPNAQRERWYVVAILMLVLAVGAYFRFLGLNWDNGHHLHPDERFITMVDAAIKWPQNLGQYFNTATSPLNPYNQNFGSFVYGTFPLFFSKAIGTLLDRDGYDKILFLGRALSALADLGTILILFLLGRKLFGSAVGLLAATLMAFTVFAIQLSHFFAFDTFTVFFAVLVLYYTTRLQLDGGLRNYLLTGVSFGFALASKSSVAWLVLPVVVAIAVRMYRQHLRQQQARSARSDSGGKAIDRLFSMDLIFSTALAAFVILAIAGLVFRILQPYAFSGTSFFSFMPNTQFLADVNRQKEAVEGIIDYPPSHQYAFTPSYLFPLKDMLLWGMGPPLGIAAWLGFIFAIYHAVRSRSARYLPLLVWVGFNFVYYGQVLAKGMRYFYPIYPPLVLFAAFALIHFWRSARPKTSLASGEPSASEDGSENGDHRQKSGASGKDPGSSGKRLRHLLPHNWRQGLALFLICFVVLTSLAYSIAYSNIYLRPTTRVAASQWIYQNIPRGTTIANEHWDDPIPLGLSPELNASLYPGLTLAPYDDDDATKLEKLAKVLDQTQYIFVTSNRLYGSIPRLPMRYPLTTEYYRLLFDGQLGFRLVKTIASYPNLGGLQINDDRGMEINGLHAFIQPDETFTVYDHPKVLIFQKTDDYTPGRIRELLGRVSLNNVVRVTPLMASKYNNGLLLSDRDKGVYEITGSWFQMFDPSDLFNRYPMIAWWLTV